MIFVKILKLLQKKTILYENRLIYLIYQEGIHLIIYLFTVISPLW